MSLVDINLGQLLLAKINNSMVVILSSLAILRSNYFEKYNHVSTSTTTMKSAICSGSKKSMEILFNVQPTLHSKNKIVPDLSEHECTYHSSH
jgi:hypothetical protein